ncbi:MAG: cob(I)yrinic acid a,c-diamide adenosyltransferase [Candidatus Zixiibacteriota bacterium]
MRDQKTKGLVIVYTGDGKGKTTAALGVALRAAGHGKRTLIIQFIKSFKDYGELKFVKKYDCGIEIKTLGKGYVKIKGDRFPFKEHVKAAKQALKFAEDQILSEKYDIIVLDEINIALDKKLLSIQEVINLIKQKPRDLHLILTGRSAPKEMIQLADLVSEVKEIKHPFRKGVLAQRGVEY